MLVICYSLTRQFALEQHISPAYDATGSPGRGLLDNVPETFYVPSTWLVEDTCQFLEKSYVGILKHKEIFPRFVFKTVRQKIQAEISLFSFRQCS